MTRYIAKRVLYAAVTLLAVLTLVFILVRISGNPALVMAPPDATLEDIEQLERSLGLDRPLIVQYISYLGSMLTGDLGVSFGYRRPVLDLVLVALPRTLLLALAAFTFAVIGGVALGTLAAFRADTATDNSARFIGLLGQSVPAFWFGIILVQIFSVQLGWLPAFGYSEPTSLILPAITLGLFPLAAFTRLTRSAVLEALNKDHIDFLRAKGVPPGSLLIHTLRTASLPVVAMSGVQLGHLVSTSIVVETLFAWPGVGQLLVLSVHARDYPLIQGMVLVNTAIVVVLFLLVDLSYGLLDPRLKVAKS